MHGEACAEQRLRSRGHHPGIDERQRTRSHPYKGVGGGGRLQKHAVSAPCHVLALCDVLSASPLDNVGTLSPLAASRITVRRPQFAAICDPLTPPLAVQQLCRPARRLPIEIIDGRGSFVTGQYV